MATITIGIMDPPFESVTIPTAFRLIDSALRKGHHVNVFLYEGAISLGHERQAGHADPVSGRPADEHPTTADWVRALFDVARERKVTLKWVNCGLCVDERGMDAPVPSAERGSPETFWKLAEVSDGFVFIGTK